MLQTIDLISRWARLYLKLGQEDEAARILGNFIEQMLAGREENDLLELVDELLARNRNTCPACGYSPGFTGGSVTWRNCAARWNAWLKLRKLPAFPTRNATP